MPENGVGNSREDWERQLAAMADKIGYFLRKSFGISNLRDLEDLTQETLLGVLEAVRRDGFRLDPNTRFTTFVLAVAKNKARDFLRRESLRRHEPLDGHAVESAAHQPHETQEMQDLINKLRRLMKYLPAEQAEVMYLMFAEGCSVAEVAEKLGLTAARVSNLKFQALEHLVRWCRKSGWLAFVYVWFNSHSGG